MTKILEFTPSQEDAVTARVLVMVHRAVDQYFPNTAQPSRQFTKTVFSDDQEATAIRASAGVSLPAEVDVEPVKDNGSPVGSGEEMLHLGRDWFSLVATIFLIIGILALAFVVSQK